MRGLVIVPCRWIPRVSGCPHAWGGAVQLDGGLGWHGASPLLDRGLQCVSHVRQPLCGLVWMRFPGVGLSYIDPPLTEPDPRDPMLEEF